MEKVLKCVRILSDHVPAKLPHLARVDSMVKPTRFPQNGCHRSSPWRLRLRELATLVRLPLRPICRPPYGIVDPTVGAIRLYAFAAINRWMLTGSLRLSCLEVTRLPLPKTVVVSCVTKRGIITVLAGLATWRRSP